MAGTKKKNTLKPVLERLYNKYNRSELIKTDPLIFVYDYSSNTDRELVAFLASSMAYGRVSQIQASLKRLLSILSPSPYKFMMSLNDKKRLALSDFKHRFNTGSDIYELLWLLRKCNKDFGSLENTFANFYNESDSNVLPALIGFTSYMKETYKKEFDREMPRGVSYLLADPKGSSPCKRLNMFLRWVVRDDDVDTGLWKSIPASKLIVPMDTHLSRLSKILGFHSKNTISMKTAVEVTNQFAEICPDDPVKYDFALSRVGIVENCTGKLAKRCDNCELHPFCLKKK